LRMRSASPRTSAVRARDWRSQHQLWTRLLRFGETQADLEHFVAFHFGNGPDQPVPFNLVADHGVLADPVGNELADGLVAVHIAEVKAIQHGYRAQLGIAFKNEIAEEAHVTPTFRRLTEELAECRQVFFLADSAEDVVFQQAGAAGWVQQGAIAKQRGDTRTWRHLELAQGRADAPFFAGEMIDEEFPLAGGMHLQAGAGNRRWDWRHFYLGLACGPRQGCALHQQRNQHNEEGYVEEQLGIVQTGNQWEDRQNHRHRTTQANPGYENALTQVEALERQQAEENRDGAGKQNHPQ